MKPSFNKLNKLNKFNKINKINTQEKDKKENSNIKNSKNSTSPIKTQPETNTQIISGYFLNEKSYKEMIIQRVNNFLYGILGFLVLFCLVSYYFVSCKEVQLNQISRETLELNYENDELQNKVDSLQSYYNIDKAVSKANILERAKQVVEVDAVKTPSVNFNKKPSKDSSLIVNY